MRGSCKFKDDCTFRHDCEPEGGLEAAKKSVICPYYLNRGRCRHKERCCFSHINPEEGENGEPSIVSSPDAPGTINKNNDEMRADKCGVCLNNVVEIGRRFALYAECQHCFCYECAKSWHRKQAMIKKQQGVDVEHTLLKHSCPECRVESDYIVPSKYFYTGEEKVKAFEDYKKKRSVQECKWFNIGVRGSCPFGPKCFYLHLDIDGSDMKPFDVNKKKGVNARNDWQCYLASTIRAEINCP